MKFPFYRILTILFFSVFSISPFHHFAISPSQWTRVDSLLNLGQPRSALELVDKIYSAAKAENNDEQVVKAIIYRIKINATFQENAMELAIREVKTEIGLSSQPRSQILHSILGELYQMYYQQNQYRFRDRSHVASNLADSVGSWDLTTLFRAATRHYLLALTNPDQLKSIPIQRFTGILQVDFYEEKQKDEKIAQAAQPTLYDFLAIRAIDFFTSDERPDILPVKSFEIRSRWMFDITSGFIRNRMFIPVDTASPESFALRIFRDLANFHMADKDRAALINSELKRMAFVHEKGNWPAKDSLYADVLRRFDSVESASPHSTQISYDLAQFLSSQGGKYQRGLPDLYKWEIRSAIEVCDKAIKRFPESDGAVNCAILKKNLLKPNLQITVEKAVPAEKPHLSLIEYKNVKEVTFRLISIDPDLYSEKSGSLNQDAMIAFLTEQKALESWELIMPSDGDFQSHALETKIPAAKTGFYILMASSSSDFKGENLAFSWAPFWSTNISYITRRLVGGSLGYYFLDRVTGSPLKNVRVEVWNRSYDYRSRSYTSSKLGEYFSDEKGFLEIPAAGNERREADIFLKISYQQDNLITENFFRRPDYAQPEQRVVQTMLYTDRAIYRPGQPVYFKGITIERTGDKTKIKPGYSSRVTFTDVNGQKISEQNFTANEFGSFNGSFTAPQDVLPGTMYISCETGSVSFRVEYYKLPTFEVSFNPMEGNYKLGEPMEIKGNAKAYAGNPVDAATVKYRVVRTARYPWIGRYWYWPRPDSPETEIITGETATDANGNFSIRFDALPDLSVDKKQQPVFDFSISAEVTDLNGEMQLTEQVVSVGYTSLQIGLNIADQVDPARDSVFKLTTTNLQGRPTPTVVKIKMMRLRQPDRPFKSREWDSPDRTLTTADQFHAEFPYDIFMDEDNPEKWKVEETLPEKLCDTSKDTLFRFRGIPESSLKPGTWMVVLTATDPFGQPVEVKKTFTLFSTRSKMSPVTGFSWFVPLKSSGQPGEKAQFMVGTAEDNVNLLYEVTCRDTVVSREWMRMSNRAMVVEVPITERYRGNFAVNFIFVKQNRVFRNTQLVTVPHTNKKLDIRLETFRDKLEPGAGETWKLKILDPSGKGADAEMLATMYDASLDVFSRHSWSLDLYRRYGGTTPWNGDHAFRISPGLVKWPVEYSGYKVAPELELNWFGYGGYYGYKRQFRYSKGGPEVMMAMDVAATPETKTEEVETEGGLQEIQILDYKPVVKESQDKPGQTQPVQQVRRDFRETAFFFPALRTDSAGTLTLQFTAPENLTKWRVMGLAHTKSLETGQLEKEVVTQKEFMVFPNAPRFVRQGDTMIFSTKIVSMAPNEVKGEIRLELSDALTLRSASSWILSTVAQPFTLGGQQSSSVSWKFVVPEGTDVQVLTWRVSARAGAFADGEEKSVPVLSNRMMVTETLPLPVRGKGSTQFTFEKLLASGNQSTLKNHRLTLEFAINPAWYAVQALPALNENPYENAESIFAAWWSNSVASHIANSNPRIRLVFNAWKSLTPDALKSNLAKNEDLKSALLRETPWVLEATSETEQKQKLGLFFDPNRLESTLRNDLAKLVRLQSPNGGWSWMAGMKENRYTTQAIVTGTGKLVHMGVISMEKDARVRNMVYQAIRFLDEALAEDFEQLKKYDPKWKENPHLGPVQIQYLYALSFFRNDLEIKNRPAVPGYSEAFAFFRDQAEKYWMKQERQMQGMISLALHRMGEQKVPALIVKSLTEKALNSTEMGMYWASDPGYFWYQSPIEGHALMIEVFEEVAANSKAVEDLKVWLLKQKQTQSWKTSRGTLEACYALLMRGEELLAPESEENRGITITMGKEKIDSEKLTDIRKEAGTGYFRLSWSGSEIRPEMGNISVTKNGPGVAWGALYWQYFENLDKITPAATPLKLKKEVFFKGKEIVPATSLVPGDKLLVRIALTVDRDLEFVHMKDMRASALEPGGTQSEQVSGYRYQDGLGYYQSMSDEAANFFFDYLPKGNYVFEYTLKVNAAGSYSNGIATIQCMYAPEFSAHSEGIRIEAGGK